MSKNTFLVSEIKSSLFIFFIYRAQFEGERVTEKGIIPTGTCCK